MQFYYITCNLLKNGCILLFIFFRLSIRAGRCPCLVRRCLELFSGPLLTRGSPRGAAVVRTSCCLDGSLPVHPRHLPMARSTSPRPDRHFGQRRGHRNGARLTDGERRRSPAEHADAAPGGGQLFESAFERLRLQQLRFEFNS